MLLVVFFFGEGSCPYLLPNFSKKLLRIFLKVSSVFGESTDPNHLEWSDVIAFEHGLTAGSGAPQFQNFVVYQYVDKSTPHLHVACATGEHFPELNLEITPSNNTGTALLKIRLYEVMFTSISMAGDAANGGSRPIETIKFIAGRIQWTYNSIGLDGTVKGSTAGCWDIVKNAACQPL